MANLFLMKWDAWRKLLCIACVLGFGVSVFAQKRQVNGTVVDINNEPIAGVNIVEKGTTNGAATDINGKFSLSVAQNATLQASFIGYISQEISNLAEYGWGGG